MARADIVQKVRDDEWEALFERLDAAEARPALDAPVGFDFAAANERFRRFARELERALGAPLSTQTGFEIQDATFHSAVHLIDRGPEAEGVWLLFSNYGELASIRREDEVPPAMLETVKRLLEQHGYRYVPSRVLARLYPRAAVTGFHRWWNRFFDHT